ncbi:MAG: VOC family protein [Pseudonocardiaceae bacterium]
MPIHARRLAEGVRSAHTRPVKRGHIPCETRSQSLQFADRRHGATLLLELNEPAGWCLIMTDPEGNEFCLH